VIAVLGEEIVCCSLEFFRCLFDDSVDFGVGLDSEAMENLTLERPTRWDSLGRCIIDTSHATLVVSSVRVLTVIDNDARMEE
jgi:hypothetical protein